MKVIFVPNYFYLNLPVFEGVIDKLKENGISSEILKLPGNTEISADNIFDQDHLKGRGFNVIEADIRLIPSYRKGIINKINFLIYSFNNLKTIRGFLKNLNPDVVVVGSDLGNLHVRFLMDACIFFKIPIVILYTCDVPDPHYKNILNSFYHLKNRIIFKSKILSYIRALLFNGNTPGEYTLESKICVISDEISQKLVSNGIYKKRITVTGMPLKNSSITGSRELILKKIGVPDNCKLIVFFTECIQNIYGNDYIKDLYVKINNIIKNISDNVFFIIKLHPLEPLDTQTFISNIFNQQNCKIMKDNNAEELIIAADLCIAHFSRVLITTALMKKRFLSLNLKNDRARTFITKEESNILEVNSINDFEKKINTALKNTDFKHEIDKAIESISKRCSSLDSYDKIVSIILAQETSII